MRVFDTIPDQKSLFVNPVLTIGSFDGLHVGHRRILSTLRNIARAKSGDPVVLTFSSHPRKVITPKTPPRILTTKHEKIREIGKCGIDNVIMLDFTKEISEMHADEFFNELILKKLGIIDIVVGYDHAFGKDREGTFEYLKERSRNRGFGVTRVEPKNFYSRPVSSTWIRTELEDGNIVLANALLGRCYTLSGTVQKGFGRGGKQLGFPTANLVPDDPDKVVPKDGVYAVYAVIDGTIRRQGMLNIGTNPTFSNTERTIEVNIFNIDEDLYGRTIELEFHDRLRDEIKFSAVEDLVAQLQKDREIALQLLNY
jgi:riboflavin kinase/FMN adenylyltransferase